MEKNDVPLKIAFMPDIVVYAAGRKLSKSGLRSKKVNRAASAKDSRAHPPIWVYQTGPWLGSIAEYSISGHFVLIKI